jgi:hypothetical protein
LAPSSPVHDYCLLILEKRMKARQDIPERPSSGTAGTLSLAEIKEVCGIGEDGGGLNDIDARKGFPDDMLKTKNNALFYVHGRGS